MEGFSSPVEREVCCSAGGHSWGLSGVSCEMCSNSLAVEEFIFSATPVGKFIIALK